jgi:hypothetical protein
MALSDWDCLAFDLDGPRDSDRMTNARGCTIRVHKSWLNVSERRSVVSGRWPRRHVSTTDRQRARINEGDVWIGDWRIVARRGPQNGIYFIAFSADYDPALREFVDRALFVGCGVYGYTSSTAGHIEAAIDLGVDPATLMVLSELDGAGEKRSVVGVRGEGDEGQVTVATDVEAPTWIGVQPESVGYLKGMVLDFVREEDMGGWPYEELAALPWDRSERVNQGELQYQDYLGLAATPTPPGQADDPLLTQALNARTQ